MSTNPPSPGSKMSTNPTSPVYQISTNLTSHVFQIATITPSPGSQMSTYPPSPGSQMFSVWRQAPLAPPHWAPLLPLYVIVLVVLDEVHVLLSWLVSMSACHNDCTRHGGLEVAWRELTTSWTRSFVKSLQAHFKKNLLKQCSD